METPLLGKKIICVSVSTAFRHFKMNREDDSCHSNYGLAPFTGQCYCSVRQWNCIPKLSVFSSGWYNLSRLDKFHHFRYFTLKLVEAIGTAFVSHCSAEKMLLKYIHGFMYYFLCVYTARCEAIVFRHDMYKFVYQISNDYFLTLALLCDFSTFNSHETFSSCIQKNVHNVVHVQCLPVTHQ